MVTTRRGPGRVSRSVLAGAAGLLVLVAAGCGEGSAGGGDDEISIGFITKSTSNPFFVKTQEAAKAAAEEAGASFTALSGEFDGDNEAQAQAVEDLMSKDVDAIIIDPSSSEGIVPTLEKAKKRDIMIVAIDTELDPGTTADATFATDNTKAGELVGAYIKESIGDEEPKVAMLDLQPGVTVGDQRHNGFLTGFGLSGDDDPAIVGSGITQGAQDKGQQVMENLLQKNGDINAVYAINEPAALGAVEAIKRADKTDQVKLGTIDGGCAGVQAVKDGDIAATAMQFPAKMSEEAVAAIIAFEKDGTKPEMPDGGAGFESTGEVLIAKEPIDGIESEDPDWGLENCWG